MQDEEAKIIGSAYRELITLVKKYAQKNQPVLFVGETGSGKERCAKLYFASNPRKGKKLTVNCAGYPENLLRSEVFGHMKGAFTDAIAKRDGHLKTCDGGILFLDELGDASPEFQAAILRVTEGNSFSPLGSDVEINPDTLVIAGTNKSVKIREDLKQRFHILPVPPLQKFDIPVMAKHFLGKMLKKDVLQELMSHDYPGNVRELKRLCEELEVERGEAIFSKKTPDVRIETGIFDYERFRFEYSIWEKYIAPILLEHNLKYKYKYFPPPILRDEKKEEDSMRIGAVMARKRYPNLVRPDLGKTMAELVKKLLTGQMDGNTLKKFVTLLDNCFMDGSLPLLLKSIDRYLHHQDQPKESRPDLAPLLNVGHKEALKRFKIEYFNYHLQIHKQNRTETATALGMKKKGLDNILWRLKGALKNASNPKK